MSGNHETFSHAPGKVFCCWVLLLPNITYQSSEGKKKKGTFQHLSHCDLWYLLLLASNQVCRNYYSTFCLLLGSFWTHSFSKVYFKHAYQWVTKTFSYLWWYNVDPPSMLTVCSSPIYTYEQTHSLYTSVFMHVLIRF